MTPNARSLKYLRDLGYHAQSVEKWNPHGGPPVSKDPAIELVNILIGDILPEDKGTKFEARRQWALDEIHKLYPIPRVGIRQDFFEFADILAFVNCTVWKDYPETARVLAVQATTKKNMLARKRKILVNPYARDWLATGNRIGIHGWHQPGGSRTAWKLDKIAVTLAMFERVPLGHGEETQG